MQNSILYYSPKEVKKREGLIVRVVSWSWCMHSFMKRSLRQCLATYAWGSTLAQYSWLCLPKIHCHFVVVLTWSAGQCFMGSTNAQDQEQALQGECLGQENSRTRKLSLLFPLAISMALNGSDCDHFMNKIMFNYVY